MAEIRGNIEPYHRGNQLSWEQYLGGIGLQLVGTSVIIGTATSKIAYAIDNISQGIAEMGASFNYGISIVSSQLEAQTKLHQEILDQLDLIRQIISSPVLTQAREYYRIGLERLGKGLLDKALESFLESEKKNDADFFTQYQLGRLYLYGKDKNNDVINVGKAVQHLNLACRYGEAEIGGIPLIEKIVAEVFLHNSIAHYIQANESFWKGNSEVATERCQNALFLAQKATKHAPEFGEAFFHCAKYQCLLKQNESAAKHLFIAIGLDTDYISRAKADKDLEPILSEIQPYIKSQMKSNASGMLNELKSLVVKYVFLSPNEKRFENSIREIISECDLRLEENNANDIITAYNTLKKKLLEVKNDSMIRENMVITLEEYEKEKQKEKESEQTRLMRYRTKNKLCLDCGKPLSIFEKMLNEKYCKSHKK